MHPDPFSCPEWEPKELWLAQVSPASATGRLGGVPLLLEAYGSRVLRLRLGESEKPDYGFVLAEPTGSLTVEVLGQALCARAGEIGLVLHLEPAELGLYWKERLLLTSTTDGHIRGGRRLPFIARGNGFWVVGLALESGEAVYGLGEKFSALNRRGKLYSSWNEDALGVNAERSYKNVPFLWSPKGWGIYVNSPAPSHHGVGYPQWSHRSYVLFLEDDVLDLFFFVGSPGSILQAYTLLTGRSPKVPKWSYGVWWSRCYYRSQDEALGVAQEIRRRRIPGDVLVLDGRAWLDVKTRCTLEWDASRYPDPKGFVERLKGLGYRLCLWEYPYVSIYNPLFPQLAAEGYFLKTASGEVYIHHWDPEPFGNLLSPLPPSGILDFTQARVVRWWQELHRGLYDLGIDVMKTDFGEQVPSNSWASNGDSGHRLHNAYALLYNRAVFETSPQKLVFARSGYSGSQRYPVHWGGDPQADWEGLAASIRGGLSWGLSGGAYYAHDIGGFYGTPDAELYVRWAQAGIFFSHVRFHGTSPREPWFFGDPAEKIVRAWLRLRMALIPYLETLAQQAAQTGKPLARALPLAFPPDTLGSAFDTQFLLGDALLVAPVLKPGGIVQVYIPPGCWYDLWTGKTLEGPEVVTVRCGLERIPLFLREGACLPIGRPAERAEEVVPEWILCAGKHRGSSEKLRILRLPEEFRLEEVFPSLLE